jgi:hypothetical protein
MVQFSKQKTPAWVKNRRNIVLLATVVVMAGLVVVYQGIVLQLDSAAFADGLLSFNTTTTTTKTGGSSKKGGPHQLAGLTCAKYGGPPDEIAAEMVYWSDIPSDAKFVSPFKKAGPQAKYLTFEPGMYWSRIDYIVGNMAMHEDGLSTISL